MPPKANKNPSANSFAALAPKETKDLPTSTQPKSASNTDAAAAVEKKIEGYFQQRMKNASTPQTGPTPTHMQPTKRRVDDIEAAEPSPSPAKKPAREDDMDTDDAVEEIISPQVTPKQQDHHVFTTWDQAVAVEASRLDTLFSEQPFLPYLIRYLDPPPLSPPEQREG
jgi:hypothetical protein